MDKIQVLIVEDDPLMLDEIRRLISSLPEAEVITSSSGDQARQLLRLLQALPLIVILDLALPDVNGMELLQDLAFQPAVGIVIVTGHAEHKVKLASLAQGADAYLRKPFDAQELLLTVSAVRRRLSHLHAQQKAASAWRFNPRDWLLIAPSGDVLALTNVELHLVDLLYRHKGKPVTRTRISAELGNYYRYTGNALEATVSRLRRKIATIDPEISLIKSVSGVGYLMSADVQ